MKLRAFLAVTFRQTISNNECGSAIGSETDYSDSPLSFLIKYKASFIRPPAITDANGYSGIHLPSRGFKNVKTNDGKSHFKSVNENHHNLTLKSEEDLNNLIEKIRNEARHTYLASASDIRRYILENIDNPEWKTFFAIN